MYGSSETLTAETAVAYDALDGEAPVGAVLDRLERLVDTLAAADVDAEPDSELRHAVVALQRLSDRLAAAQLRALAAVDRRQAHRHDGAITAASWLRGRTRLDHGQAGRRVEAARRLRRLPRVQAALAAGTVTLDHATAITAAARPHRLEAIAACEDVLVQLAARGRPADVRRALRLIADQVDRDGTDAPPLDDRGLDQRRDVDVRHTVDGLVDGRLRLDQLHGEALLTVIDAYDTPDAADTPPERRRSAGQRRADALGAALLALLDRGIAPSRQGRKPHLTLTVDLATLLDVHAHGDPAATAGDLAARLAADSHTAALLTANAESQPQGASAAADTGPDAPDADSDADSRAVAETAAADGETPPPARPPRPPRLRHTGELDADRARRLAAVATVQAVLTLGPWRVVNVGRTQRTLPAWLRGALEAVHGRCRGPDCDRPITWTDAHHLIAWALQHGITDLNQIIPLCRAHHQLVTIGGWTVTYDPDTGICTWTGPQGRTRHTHPH